MTRKQLMASVLSIALMTSAVPAPALAEALDSAQQPAAEQSADAAVGAEVPETEGVPADEKDPAATTESSDTTAEAATTDGEKDEVSAAADDEAAPDEEEPAPAEDDAADATNEQQAPATVLTAAESATPAPQAAGDPYATEAPAHGASAFVGKYGTVSYYYDNGTLTGSVAIPKADAIKSIGEPVHKANGGWKVTVTLKSDLTAAQLNVPSWHVSDGANKYIDAGNSKLTIEFSTDSDTDSSWSCSGPARASIKFTTEKPAQPAVAFDINDVLDLDSVYVNVNGTRHQTPITSASNVVSEGQPVYHGGIRMPYWSVDVTIKVNDVTAADYGIPTGWIGNTDPDTWVVDTDQPTNATVTFVLYDGQSSWRASANGALTNMYFKYEPAPFDMREQVNKANNVAYVVYDENGNREYAGSASLVSLGGMGKVEKEGDPERQVDGTWAVDVTLAEDTLTSLDQTNVPAYLLKHDKGDYVLDLASSDRTGTYRTTGSGTTYTITGTDRPTFVFRYKAPQEPQAPAFTYDGTVPVRYELRNADGTLITSGTTTRHDELASVSDPYLDEEGNWAVHAWMPTLTPAGLGIDGSTLGVDDLDAAFALDEDASKTAVTLRTDGQDGTVYRCEGEDGPLYVYTAKSQLDLSGEQKPTDEKPGDVQDTKTDEKDEKDESADEGKALPRTSDPSSLQSVATAALSGMSALLAALGVSSRRRRNG